MGMYVQTLGFHDLSVPPSLQVVSEYCRVLFNVGENSQRYVTGYSDLGWNEICT